MGRCQFSFKVVIKYLLHVIFYSIIYMNHCEFLSCIFDKIQEFNNAVIRSEDIP